MPEQTGASPGGPLAMMLPLAVMFVIFYFLVFRPQAKSRKEHERMLAGLKKHDEVTTTGGLIGTVVNVKSQTVTLRIDEHVRVEVERSAIARLLKSRADATQATAAQPSPTQQ